MGDEFKQEILMKNNVMVKAKYNITTIENKIFQLILYKFQKNSDDTLVCEIPKSEFVNIITRKNDKTIKGIGDILEELRKSSIEIETEKEWLRYGFINGFTYNEENEIFKIEATRRVYELLQNYLKNYTPVNLAIVFSLKSFYAQRFYELLRLWSNTKQVINYSIDYLKQVLKLENQYADYNTFKRRVVIQAIKELNEKANMEIEFKENKTGRKVTSIDFIVKDNDKRKYFQDNQQDKSDNKSNNQYGNDKTLRFNDFEQRTYDYDLLEKKLLGWDED